MLDCTGSLSTINFEFYTNLRTLRVLLSFDIAVMRDHVLFYRLKDRLTLWMRWAIQSFDDALDQQPQQDVG